MLHLGPACCFVTIVCFKESSSGKVVIFPLKGEWYKQIKAGDKRVEYRADSTYWASRIRNAETAIFQHGH